MATKWQWCLCKGTARVDATQLGDARRVWLCTRCGGIAELKPAPSAEILTIAYDPTLGFTTEWEPYGQTLAARLAEPIRNRRNRKRK